MQLRLKQYLIDLQCPQVMGILNITPDSFSDGGQFLAFDQALRRAEEMAGQGAAILDIGGESTRPGAGEVALQQELDRVIPVIEALTSRIDLPISIDTSKAQVMREAVNAGAAMINDVCALQNEGALEVAHRANVPICLMHMKGQPRTMQENPSYEVVVQDVKQFLLSRAQICQDAGILRERIILDPGFGFGKTLDHNLSLLKHLSEVADLGYPLLVGISRKRMIAQILEHDSQAAASERMVGSLEAAMCAVERGAKIIRTHNVRETVEACKVFAAVNSAL